MLSIVITCHVFLLSIYLRKLYVMSISQSFVLFVCDAMCKLDATSDLDIYDRYAKENLYKMWRYTLQVL
jgi:hypothetical protein